MHDSLDFLNALLGNVAIFHFAWLCPPMKFDPPKSPKGGVFPWVFDKNLEVGGVNFLGRPKWKFTSAMISGMQSGPNRSMCDRGSSMLSNSIMSCVHDNSCLP